MIRGYFDESYKDHRVYAIGGYIGRDRDWRAVSRQWRNRRLKDGVQCFHAVDCENGHGEFENLGKDGRVRLKTDLIQIVDAHENLGGFSSAVIIEDFYKVRGTSERAKQVLGPSPYFLCFQILLSDVCVALEKAQAGPGVRVAYVFEEQEEFSGRAQQLFNQFKAINQTYAPKIGTVKYVGKHQSVPLELADNLAYETMKEILNHRYDPARPRRISMAKMIPKIRCISLMTEAEIQKLVMLGKTARDLGFK